MATDDAGEVEQLFAKLGLATFEEREVFRTWEPLETSGAARLYFSNSSVPATTPTGNLADHMAAREGH